jgi:hypothetical protein
VQQKATRLWEYELPEPLNSFEMNPDGSLIAGQTVGKNRFALNTRTMAAGGNTKETDSVIKISGGGIVGMSAGKLHTYSSSGNLTRTVDVVTGSAPSLLVLPSCQFCCLR